MEAQLLYSLLHMLWTFFQSVNNLSIKAGLCTSPVGGLGRKLGVPDRYTSDLAQGGGSSGCPSGKDVYLACQKVKASPKNMGRGHLSSQVLSPELLIPYQDRQWSLWGQRGPHTSHHEPSSPADLSGYETNRQQSMAPMSEPTAGTAKRSFIHSTNHARALQKWEARDTASYRKRRSLL